MIVKREASFSTIFYAFDQQSASYLPTFHPAYSTSFSNSFTNCFLFSWLWSIWLSLLVLVFSVALLFFSFHDRQNPPLLVYSRAVFPLPSLPAFPRALPPLYLSFLDASSPDPLFD